MPGFAPLRRIEELNAPGIQPDQCVRVSTASVVVADYARLQADFPQLEESALSAVHGLDRLARPRRAAAVRRIIDDWLLRHGALVSTAQAAQARVNSPIAHDGDPVPVHRPPRYGRSVVVSLRASNESLPPGRRGPWADEPDGLLDLKGVGVASGVRPTIRFGNPLAAHGLCPLGTALCEYSWQGVIDAAFRHAGAEFRVLPIYAVIDLGFDDDRGRPAGLLMRRAHARHAHDLFHASGSAEHRATVILEMLLRRYGITSTRYPGVLTLDRRGDGARFFIGHHRRRIFTPAQIRRALEILAPGQRRASYLCVNLQTTTPVMEEPPATQMFDLELIGASRAFRDPVAVLVADRPFRFGGALAPDHQAFVQPDPRLVLPAADWGTRRPSRREQRAFALPRDIELAEPYMAGLQLAKAWRAGAITRGGVAAQLRARLGRATSRWPRSSDALPLALSATDALLEACATTGTQLLGLSRGRRRARAEAAELLLLVGDLLDPEARSAPVGASRRLALDWAARRIMASRAIRRADRELARRIRRRQPAASLDRAAGALSGGEPVERAALAAAERLRNPTAHSPAALAADLELLTGAEPFAACVAGWVELVRDRGTPRVKDARSRSASVTGGGSRREPARASPGRARRSSRRG